jgi:hypothetical protein
MVRAIKENVIIGPGGLIEIRRPELPAGTTAEVIVMIESPDAEPPPLTALLGRAHSGYRSGAEADAFLRAERDAWDR